MSGMLQIRLTRLFVVAGSVAVAVAVAACGRSDAVVRPRVALRPDGGFSHGNRSEACPILPQGDVKLCTNLGSGPSFFTPAYLEISEGGAAYYACAWDWQPVMGYRFRSEMLLGSPAVCCDPDGTPRPEPLNPLTTHTQIYFGQPHAPPNIKPQELRNDMAGDVRGNPFTMTVVNADSGSRARDAIETWQSWAGDGLLHMGSDSGDSYYFPLKLTINFSVVEDAQHQPVLLIGPEVAMGSPNGPLLGHPTLASCRTGAGVPLCLIGGEIVGTVLNNSSGRCGNHPSVTEAALRNAAALLQSYGIAITDIDYRPTTH